MEEQTWLGEVTVSETGRRKQNLEGHELQEEESYEVRSWKTNGGKRWWSYQMEMESAPPGSDL